MLQITIGDDAIESLHTIANVIPQGYIVAVLREDEDVPLSSDITPGIDYVWWGCTGDHVCIREVNPKDSSPIGPVKLRRWDTVDRIHVY